MLVLRIVAVILALALVGTLVLAVIGYRKNQAYDRADAARRAALVAAEQFALRMDDFAAPSAQAYENRIERMLTTKGKADFGQVKQIIGQVYAAAQPKAKSSPSPTGKVIYAGLSDIDSDSATALVAHDSTIASTGKSLHFRWTVSLKLIGGRWLVDGLPPEVAGGGTQ